MASAGRESTISSAIGPSTAPASTSSACVVGVAFVTLALATAESAAVPDEMIVGLP